MLIFTKELLQLIEFSEVLNVTYCFVVCQALVYCSDCKKSFVRKFSKHPHSVDGIDDSGFDFPGIELIPEFVTVDEELEICNSIDQVPWVDSQSGRRKQVSYMSVSQCILSSFWLASLPLWKNLLMDGLQQLFGKLEERCMSNTLLWS